MDAQSGSLLVWHFMHKDRCLYSYEKLPEEEPVKVVPGQTLRISDEPVPYFRGFHGATEALSALVSAPGIVNAPGPVVQRAVLNGAIKTWPGFLGGYSACATERTCLWLTDASHVLHEFSLWCVEEALRFSVGRWEVYPPDRQLLDAKREWLRGKISSKKLETMVQEAWWRTWEAVGGVHRFGVRHKMVFWDSVRLDPVKAVNDAVFEIHLWRTIPEVELNAELERRLLALAQKKEGRSDHDGLWNIRWHKGLFP